MRIYIIILYSILNIQFSFLNAGDKIWTKQYGSTAADIAYSVSTDTNGFIYISGQTYGNFNGVQSIGASDCFLVKLDSSGTRIWTKLYGTIFDEIAPASTIFSNNFIFAAGATGGSFDGRGITGSLDIFLIKFDSEGRLIFTKQFGTIKDEYVNSMTTDVTGNVYLVGYTMGGLNGKINAGQTDAYLMKLDADGNLIWTNQFGTDLNDSAFGVKIDQKGFAYVCGYTAGNLDGNVNSGNGDAFLIKFDTATGNKIWTKQFGTPNSDYARSVTIDSTGSFIYVTGYTSGNLDGNLNSGLTDCFLVKFSSAGNKILTKQFGTKDEETVYGISIDAKNYLYLAGWTNGSLLGNANSGLTDSFLIKLDADGNRIWTKQFGTANLDYAYSVSVFENSAVYVTGYTTGNLDGNTNAGLNDIYLIKFDPSGELCKESCFECTVDNTSKCSACSANYFKKAELNFPTECYASETPPQGYFFNSSAFSKCNESCASCKSALPICASCSSGFYKKAELNFPTECFGENSPPQGYLLEQSKFIKCNDSCAACISLVSMCSSCSSGFYKKEELNFPSDCYAPDFPPLGYFFNSSAFSKCHESCSSCKSAFTTCLACSESYYKKKSELNFPAECFSKNSPPHGYFFDGSGFSKCNESCASCTISSNCISCSSGFYKKAELNFPSDCYDPDFPPLGYFFNSSAFSKCHESCSSCKSAFTTCLACSESYYKKKSELNFPAECFSKNSPQHGYFFDGSGFSQCNESCTSCISRGTLCISCSNGFYKKAELNFQAECFAQNSPPKGYYFENSAFYKCHESCLDCSGPNVEQCIDQKISCIENCLFCKVNNTCEVCREGFQYIKSSNSCEIINTAFCKNFDSNRKCLECFLGYSLTNNVCECKGIIDQSFCCPRINFCSPENTKYVKEIDSCGCQQCDSKKFRYNYQCVSQEIPNTNCFIFDKKKSLFIEITANECLESLPNFKIIYHQFCLQEKYISKFPLEHKDKRVFIFSMNEKGIYQYLKHSYPQEAILDLECNENIHSYVYLGLKCDVPFDEGLVMDIKKSKFIIPQNNEKLKNGDTITHDFLEDFFKAYLDECGGEVNYFKRENLKDLCFSIKSNMIDLENNVCKSFSYCSKTDDDLLTTINKEKCFKCVSSSYVYDVDRQNCFTYMISNKSLRDMLKLFFISSASGIVVITAVVLSFLYFKTYKTNPEMRLKIKEIGIIVYAVIDLFLDLSFFLSSSFINTNLKYIASICFFLQPVILFFVFAFLLLFKKGGKESCNIWYKRLLLALPIGFLFTIMSMLQLIGKSFEIINSTFTGLINVKVNLKLWIKLADLILESLPEIIMKIIVISLSSDYNLLNLISMILSIFGLIFSIFYLTSEWVNAVPNEKDVFEANNKECIRNAGSVAGNGSEYKVVQTAIIDEKYTEKQTEKDNFQILDVKETNNGKEELNSDFQNNNHKKETKIVDEENKDLKKKTIENGMEKENDKGFICEIDENSGKKLEKKVDVKKHLENFEFKKQNGVLNNISSDLGKLENNEDKDYNDEHDNLKNQSVNYDVSNKEDNEKTINISSSIQRNDQENEESCIDSKDINIDDMIKDD